MYTRHNISPVIFPVPPTLPPQRDLNFIYYFLHLSYFHNMKQKKKTHLAKNMTFETKIFDGREILFDMEKQNRNIMFPFSPAPKSL